MRLADAMDALREDDLQTGLLFIDKLRWHVGDFLMPL